MFGTYILKCISGDDLVFGLSEISSAKPVVFMLVGDIYAKVHSFYKKQEK